MSVKIRLARGGSKKKPFYRVVVADVRAPRDGDFIEKLGTYNPLLSKDNKERIVLKNDRIKYWLDQGAQPSDRVVTFIQAAGIELPKSIQQKVAVKLKTRVARAPKKEAQA